VSIHELINTSDKKLRDICKNFNVLYQISASIFNIQEAEPRPFKNMDTSFVM
jgi:benzoyl-CoA reductase/2-hydroxyglutaryl-CoA dehydratase subunit BcrC/BadD/HgdB